MFASFFTAIGLLLLLKINLAVSQCNHGDVNLIGGTDDYEGNVQLCKNGTWGYVCHRHWSTNDAKVLCRQLGFSATSAYFRQGSYYGYGNGTVWPEGLLCNGNENRLIECPTGIYSSCESAYSRIAGVFCGSGKNCTNGTVRLAIASNSNSYGRSEGEVQVCYNNQWGYACSSGWSTTASTVVCKQLGYTGYSDNQFYGFSRNTGLQIWFDSVICNSSSTSLFNCQYQIRTSTCSQYYKIGIMCSATDSSSCVSNTVKLWSAYDSTPNNEGIPLVCISGTWYPIYDGSSCFSLNLACKAAGYDGLEYYRTYAGRFYGYYYKTHYSFSCSSSSTNLFSNIQCTNRVVSYSSSIWDYSFGVRCFKRIDKACSSEGSFRLTNSSSSNEGRIENCYNNHWTPMCSINRYTANIICKELGYRPTNSLIFSDNEFGKSDSINSDFRYLHCSSSSTHLSQCSAIKGSICTSTCSTHYGLRCYEPANECVNGGVRLVDGNIEQEGRVEVCVDGIWGQICGTGWNINDAYVACVSLGYNGNANPTRHSTATEFGLGYGPIVWSSVNCYHWNNDIHDCRKSVIPTFYCNNRYIAGARCTEGCSDGDVRLVGGSSVHEGTVEICYDELWGLISDDGWSDSNAIVVCRQLGFNGEGGVKSIQASFYGKPRKTIHLKEVNCSSDGTSLLACNNTRLSVDDGIALISSTDVAGVNCQPSPSAVHSCLSMFESCSSNGSVRLIGNGSKDEGLVEYCVGGALWTSLCNIDNKVATVICRQLGYTSYSWGSIILNTDDKPYSLLEGISCSGEESNLIECDNNSTGLSTAALNGCIECSEHSIGLRCFNSIATGSCNEGSVRLVNGSSNREGRVEVCVNGMWGSVCDNGWDSTDGFIVCQQLGYTREEPSIYSNSYFGDGSYPIVYSSIDCKGWEDSISDCDKDGYLSYTCYPGHTAGLKCNGENVNAENVGSNSDNSGGSSAIIGVTSSLFIIVIVIFIGVILALFFVMRKRSRRPATETTGVPASYSAPATTQNKDIQMKSCPVYEEMDELSYDNRYCANRQS